MPKPRHLVAALLALAIAVVVPATAHGQPFGRTVSVAGVGHDKGSDQAKVFVIEFADFGCSYCARFSTETYPKIDSAYIKSGRVKWKYVPFVIGMFRNSREMAEGAECAGEQGAFWKMHDLLYARRKEWMASSEPRAVAGRYARELKLDVGKFTRCTMRPDIRERIARNDALASALAIRGTPTFFVNGRVIPGAIPWDLFQQVIEAAGR